MTDNSVNILAISMSTCHKNQISFKLRSTQSNFHTRKKTTQIIKSVTIFELHTFAAIGIRLHLLTEPARFGHIPLISKHKAKPHLFCACLLPNVQSTFFLSHFSVGK